MERWKRLAMVVALLIAGVVFIALYAQFQQLLLHPFAFIGAVVLAVILLARSFSASRSYPSSDTRAGSRDRRAERPLAVPDPDPAVGRRQWRSSPALALARSRPGAPAFLGLLIGIFLFMGFIWSVIGE